MFSFKFPAIPGFDGGDEEKRADREERRRSMRSGAPALEPIDDGGISDLDSDDGARTPDSEHSYQIKLPRYLLGTTLARQRRRIAQRLLEDFRDDNYNDEEDDEIYKAAKSAVVALRKNVKLFRRSLNALMNTTEPYKSSLTKLSGVLRKLKVNTKEIEIMASCCEEICALHQRPDLTPVLKPLIAAVDAKLLQFKEISTLETRWQNRRLDYHAYLRKVRRLDDVAMDKPEKKDFEERLERNHSKLEVAHERYIEGRNALFAKLGYLEAVGDRMLETELEELKEYIKNISGGAGELAAALRPRSVFDIGLEIEDLGQTGALRRQRRGAELDREGTQASRAGSAPADDEEQDPSGGGEEETKKSAASSPEDTKAADAESPRRSSVRKSVMSEKDERSALKVEGNEIAAAAAQVGRELELQREMQRQRDLMLEKERERAQQRERERARQQEKERERERRVNWNLDNTEEDDDDEGHGGDGKRASKKPAALAESAGGDASGFFAWFGASRQMTHSDLAGEDGDGKLGAQAARRRLRAEPAPRVLEVSDADEILYRVFAGRAVPTGNVIRDCSRDALLRQLPTLLCWLSQTPVWLDAIVNEIGEALRERCDAEPCIAMQIDMFSVAQLAPAWVFNAIRPIDSVGDVTISMLLGDGTDRDAWMQTGSELSQMSPSADEFLRMCKHIMSEEREPGFIVEVGQLPALTIGSFSDVHDALTDVRHPFEPSLMVESMELAHVFDSNAKPYLITLNCHPEGRHAKAALMRMRSGRTPKSAIGQDGAFFTDKGMTSAAADRHLLAVTAEKSDGDPMDKNLKHQRQTSSMLPSAWGALSRVLGRDEDGQGEHKPKVSNIILKAGDDLRRDTACLQFFQLVNWIWAQSKLRVGPEPVQAETYGILPMGITQTAQGERFFGAIEVVEGCKALTDLEPEDVDSSVIPRLVASAAGSYMAAWLLRIRDRHSDNILIDPSNGRLLHIDFGMVLGSGATIDTAEFAITPSLRDALVMHNAWGLLVQTCCKAFAVLRKSESNVRLLLNTAEVLCAPAGLDGRIARECVSGALMLGMNMPDSVKKIAALVNRGPDAFKTRLKNRLHGYAQAFKRYGERKDKEKKEKEKEKKDKRGIDRSDSRGERTPSHGRSSTPHIRNSSGHTSAQSDS